MSRLHAELHRLYLVPSPAAAGAGPASPGLIGPEGQVRALVVELAQPASWQELSALWQGVQRELELPAPGIAVSGRDALQLWFSLAEPVPPSQAHAFLAAACARFLPEVAPQRLRLWPAVDDAPPHRARHAPLVPAGQAEADHWSAFVAPDLAPVFADTPWLDIPPSAEGQADLLSRLASIGASALAAALQRLHPAGRTDAAAQTAMKPSLDPKRFLLQVMGDETAPLALRVDAAKALLPYTERPPKP